MGCWKLHISTPSGSCLPATPRRNEFLAWIVTAAVRPPGQYKGSRDQQQHTAAGPYASSAAWRVPRLIGRIAIVLLVAPLALIVVFRFLPPPITPLMVIRLIQGEALHHQWVAYEAIAPALAHAAIASEDNLFCQEVLGFDIEALRGQVEAWEEGDKPRGASTITMQTAKNLLLWPGRDPVRKVFEAWLTPLIALLWP